MSVSGDIKEVARIFCKEPLIPYQLRINEEAAKLAENDISLLGNRGALLEKARAALVESGTYMFKKGWSRSKSALSAESTESNPSPSVPRKKTKLAEDARHGRMKDVEEKIRDIDDAISFKEKRRAQAESVRDYRQCDELTEQIGSLKAFALERAKFAEGKRSPGTVV